MFTLTDDRLGSWCKRTIRFQAFPCGLGLNDSVGIIIYILKKSNNMGNVQGHMAVFSRMET